MIFFLAVSFAPIVHPQQKLASFTPKKDLPAEDGFLGSLIGSAAFPHIYIERFSRPTLKARDIVVMDNRRLPRGESSVKS